MNRIPFGIERLDSLVGGGAPTGSVVLLSGESGAGAREFVYTSAAMNAVAQVDDEFFELHHDGLHDAATVPPEVHYLSFTADEQFFRREMTHTMETDFADLAIDEIHFADLSAEYFHNSPVPQKWYLGEMSALRDMGSRSSRDDVLTSLGTYLSEHAAGNLVIIDSVTDLVSIVSEEASWNDITLLLKGLAKASHRWGGLVLLLVNAEMLTTRELGQLKSATDGTFQFNWESGGSKRARTMVVQEFRGVLSQLEEEDIVQFETEINDGGFDISDVRKIR